MEAESLFTSRWYKVMDNNKQIPELRLLDGKGSWCSGKAVN